MNQNFRLNLMNPMNLNFQMSQMNRLNQMFQMNLSFLRTQNCPMSLMNQNY